MASAQCTCSNDKKEKQLSKLVSISMQCGNKKIKTYWNIKHTNNKQHDQCLAVLSVIRGSLGAE